MINHLQTSYYGLLPYTIYFPSKSPLSRGELWCHLCSCKSFTILKASAICSAHSGGSVDKLHVTTWQMLAMQTFLREPNTTEWILVEHAAAMEGSFALAVLSGCTASVKIKHSDYTTIYLTSLTVVNSMSDRQAKIWKSPLCHFPRTATWKVLEIPCLFFNFNI